MNWLDLLRPRRKYLARAEYWIYLPTEEAPTQDAVMTRMIRESPYSHVIGPSEGLVFSDIRLHVALVLRQRNPHLFRPDLFECHIEPSSENLEALSEAKAIYRARYISEQPLKDTRHLQFLTHMSAAVAHLSGAKVILDEIAQRLMSDVWLDSELRRDPDGTRPDLHLRVVWLDEGQAETRGLGKIGLPEIRTEPADGDQRVIVTSVLEDAARQAWTLPELPPKISVEAYGDRFELHLTPTHKGPYHARVFRGVSG